MADTIDEAIEEQAIAGIQKSTADGLTVEAIPIPDLIAAENHQGAKALTTGGRSGWRGLRPARVVPPGSIGPRGTD